MSPPGSVSCWLEDLKAGDVQAAQALWERYFASLVALAGARLRACPRRGADEEDVALSAFDTFCRRAGRGRFPQLQDRDDLWKVLIKITACKATDLIRREARQKRGGGRGRRDLEWEQVVGAEPTPEFAAQVAEEYQRLLGLLGDETLRIVAVLKMEGHTAAEIAGRLGCTERTVERKLRVIRSIWPAQEAP